MKKAEFICIVCPRSCRISVTQDDEGLKVSGHSCKRGEQFAKDEFTRPMRMLTSTVRLQAEGLTRLPVISEREIPKEMLRTCLDTLNTVCVQAPVKEGDVIVPNIGGTGVDLLSARTVLK